MPDTISLIDSDTDIGDDTDCCAHYVRVGFSVTYSDGCRAECDADGFTFTHAHPHGSAVVTYDEPDAE